MRLKYLILTYIFISLSSILFAQQKLTVEMARDMALKNNKQVAIASENREIAKNSVKVYRANFLPKFSATGNYLLTTASLEKKIDAFHLPTFVPDATGQLVPNILTTVDGIPVFKEYAYFPGMDLSLKPNGTYITGLSVEMPIYVGGKISSAYKMSKIGVEMARLNETKTQNEVILLADQAYWTYVETLELEKTAQMYIDLVKQLEKDVTNLYNVGMVPRNDLLKVQVKLNEIELQLLRAENGVRLSKMNLCHVVGLPLNSDITVDQELGCDAKKDFPMPNLFSRPEYELLSKQIEIKEQQVQIVKSDFLPRLGIAGSMNYANGLKLNDNMLLDNTALSAVVSVSIPVFHWGEGRNKVRNAISEKKLASLQRDELAEKMELEIQKTLHEFNEAEARVRLTKNSLNQAEENLRESRDRYQLGLEKLSDLLEAQAMWQKARSEMISANSAYKIAETSYLKAAGRIEN